jgi:hypothetical protein
MIACVFDIVAGVVLAVTSLLLAYSACNNKHRSLVMTWLIADMIITCVNIFFLVATFFVAAEPTRFNYVLAIIFDIGKYVSFIVFILNKIFLEETPILTIVCLHFSAYNNWILPVDCCFVFLPEFERRR